MFDFRLPQLLLQFNLASAEKNGDNRSFWWEVEAMLNKIIWRKHAMIINQKQRFNTLKAKWNMRTVWCHREHVEWWQRCAFGRKLHHTVRGWIISGLHEWIEAQIWAPSPSSIIKHWLKKDTEVCKRTFWACRLLKNIDFCHQCLLITSEVLLNRKTDFIWGVTIL